MTKYRDLIVGVVFLVFTGFYLYQSTLIEIAGDSGVGPMFFPEVIAGLTGLLSVILIVMSLNKLKREAGLPAEKPAEKAKEADKPNNAAVVLTILLILAFVGLFEPIGFVPMAAAYLFLQFNVAAPKSQKTLKHQAYYLVGSLVAAFGINYIFVMGFNVMLPQGILDTLMY